MIADAEFVLKCYLFICGALSGSLRLTQQFDIYRSVTSVECVCFFVYTNFPQPEATPIVRNACIINKPLLTTH